jgi:hypothetical protein
MREARKKRCTDGKEKAEERDKPEVEKKKKKQEKTKRSDGKTGESRASSSFPIETKPNEETYVAVFVKGKCVAKKELKI